VYRLTARILSVALLLVLGVCIGGPALDPAFELPAQHFDGDADDSGHVGEIFTYWVDAAVSETLAPAPATVPLPQPPADEVLKPPPLAREPLGSRAPPA
jgi:hypothetical protein